MDQVKALARLFIILVLLIWVVKLEKVCKIRELIRFANFWLLLQIEPFLR